jgi:transcription elongation factor GreA
VGERASDNGVVEPGMLVTVDLAGDELRFLLGSREVAPSEDIEVYSEKSPLGSALLGRKIGESTSYQAPNGNQIPVKVIDATPYTG